MKKVLIAEDDELTAQIYQEHLKKAGYAISIARDGEEALEMIRASKPDAILLDLMLPRVDGIKVLKTVRSQPSLADLPVIVISVGYLSDMLQQARDAGATRILTKGDFTPEQITKKLQAALGHPETVNGKRVLIVEDNDLVAEIYCKTFLRAGFKVDIAPDGETALSMISLHPPDIVLLDLVLPSMGGIEVLHKLRAKPEGKNLPVIAFSVSYRESLLAEATNAGANEVLSKVDFTPEQVVQEVRSLLNDAHNDTTTVIETS